MAMGQGGDVPNIKVGPIGGSLIDGMMIAIIDLVMVEVLNSLESIDVSRNVWGIDFLNLIGVEWALIIFGMNMASVIGAYAVAGWIGVFVYLVGWIIIASQVAVIGLGLVPILAGVGVLVLFEVSDLNSGRGSLR